MPVTGLLLLVALAAPPGDLLRLDFDEPQIVLTPGGRAGACDAVRFTADGRQLLAVGDDKVIHTWAVGPAGLDYLAPVRWNVFRERRGAIYALALSPDGKLAAVAGYGRKDADVVILDRATGEVRAALSTENNAGYTGKAVSTVWCLAFDATGERLAVGQEDGSVWEWPIGRPAIRRADPLAVRPTPFTRRMRTVWVGFAGPELRFARGDGTVSAAGPDGPRKLFDFGYTLARAVAPDDGRWLAGCPLDIPADGCRVECRALPTGEVRHAIPFTDRATSEHLRRPVALACDPAGRRLAVGTHWPLEPASRFSPLLRGDVRLYDLTAGANPTQLANVFLDGGDGRPALAPESIGVHPTDDMLAVAGGPDHETGLWRRTNDTFERVGPPAVGVGRGVWQVGSRADGTVLCFRQQPVADAAGPNARGIGDWRAFDLARPGWAAADGNPPEPAGAIDTLNDWSVEIDPLVQNKWTAKYKSADGGLYSAPVPFDDNLDGELHCYTFLPTADPLRTRLAVGTHWGFVLLELQNGVRPRVLARGVGHQGPVMSLAPARNGAVLVSGSRDQTVGLWVLKPWDHQPILGAGFEWRTDRTGAKGLYVTAVANGSPAWEAGLYPDDQVVGLSFAAAPLAPPTDAVLDKLRVVEPDREIAFYLSRPGPDGKPFLKGTKTRLLTRPQARLFPAGERDWVLYQYADYFFASSTAGDAYLGWQIAGRTAADTPEFHPAGRLKEQFFAPDRVAETLSKLVLDPARQRAREYLPPAVSVAASAATLPADKPLTVTITAASRVRVNDETKPLEKVELWLGDDVRLKTWSGLTEAAFTGTVELTAAQLRVGRNKLTAVAYARTRGEATAEVDNPVADRPLPAVHGLAVGVDQYPYLPAAAQLTAAANDARLIKETLDGLAKSNAVRTSRVELLLNADATPAAVLDGVKRLGGKLGPDDWLVVFLAGHGLAEPDAPTAAATTGERGGIGRMKPGTWFFCAAAPNAGPAVAAAGPGGNRAAIDFTRDVRTAVGQLQALGCTLTGDQLLKALAELNCRKLVLLDSCHSGAIEQDAGRDLRPDDRGAVVLTAAAPDETAAELDLIIDRDGKRVSERHGAFSAAVYHALTRDRLTADRDRDGRLTLEELHRAVATAVRDARRRADPRSPRTQTVLACPPDLRNVVFVPAR